MTVQPAGTRLQTGWGQHVEGSRGIRLPHLSKVTPSKLVRPALTGFGLSLVVEQLLGLDEFHSVLDQVTWAWGLGHRSYP